MDEKLSAEPGAQKDAYQVLARKYRPSDFTGLIGQEALVKTLTNAFSQGRIAHAFMLTGVRGVGKTTTARIIARALNCTGADGKRDKPDIHPCGECEHCRAIAESRHIDVQEMDAASRTGIDDIREIIEGVRYAPASARYKVYIIDEVHMLSKQAFNGLLKTLEEPPPHVKFIFATTEIRRVPVTVLSRCQRFDLRRIETSELAAHFRGIAQKEAVEIDEGALSLIARAAEGSVRDGLSLLDQAIAQSDGPIAAPAVRDMLGLADRGQILDLFEKTMRGDIPGALSLLDSLYDHGADPLSVMQDLLDICHFITRLKIAPAAEGFFDGGTSEAARASDLAGKLSVAILTRTWSMLLKGLFEVRDAVRPLAALEMVLIRLNYAADLPPTGKLIRSVMDAQTQGNRSSGNGSVQGLGSSSQGGNTSVPAQHSQAPTFQPAPNAPMSFARPQATPRMQAAARPQLQTKPQEVAADPMPLAQSDAPVDPAPKTLEEVAELAAKHNQHILKVNVETGMHLIHIEPGRLEFRPGQRAPATLAGDLAKKLTIWTGMRWVVSVAKEGGSPTLYQQRQAAKAAQRERVLQEPMVRAVVETFPGADIVAVRETEISDTDMPDESGNDD